MDSLNASASKSRAEPERIAFITGKLAEASLSEVLAKLAPDVGFAYEVVRLNIAVAALMTADWVSHRLQLPDGVGRAVLPGHCRGDLEQLAKAHGVPFELGPKDLRALPRFFGRELGRPADYGAHDIEIVAEINHVPRLSPEEVLRVAHHYRDSGADVIDLGCDPDGPFPGLGQTVQRLKAEDFRVSVDSLDSREIEAAVSAGAELVLSVNGTNIDAVGDLDCELVAIPDDAPSLGGLDATIDKLEAKGARYRIDPILEPIGFGFAASLGRYLETRRRYPEAEILMGIGNLTELTGVDTAAVNVILLGFCAELEIHSVLTTEVAAWTSSCVRELHLARQLVHYAVRGQRVPKHIEPGLHLLRDEEVLRYGPEKLEALARSIKDRNFRIFAEDGMLHAMSSEGHFASRDPFELFEKLGVTEPSHAFYLGYELAKAITALTLDKNYTQDQSLRWGLLTVEEESHLERRRARDRTSGDEETPS